MKRLYFLLTLLLFLNGNLLSITNPLETTGKNSGLLGEFSTEFGFNARNLGMGKAGVADSFDSSVLYYNPAGLGFLNYAELSIMYSALYQTGNFFSIGYVHPFSEKGTLGISMVGVFIGGIEKFDSFGLRTGESYSYSDNCITIGYARRAGKKLSFGGNFKIAGQIFDTKTAFGVGLDAGMLVKINKYFQIATVIQNIIGPYLKLTSNTEKYPFNIKTGIALRLFDNDMTILSDIGLIDVFNYANAESVSFPNLLRYHIGIEYIIFNFLPLRLGWDGTEINIGLGFYMRSFKIDYALAIHSLNLSHRFSLKSIFGIPIPRKEKYLNERETFINAKFHIIKADECIKAGRIEKAKLELKQVKQVPDELTSLKSKVEKEILRAEKIKEAKKIFKEVESLYNNRKFDIALRKMEDVFSLTPDYEEAKSLHQKIINSLHAEESYKKAINHFADKNYSSSYDEIRLALKLFPEKKDYKKLELKLRPYINKLESITHCNTALNLLKKKYFERALDEVNEALELNPENRDAVTLKGKIIYKKALIIYDEAILKFNNSEYSVVIELYEEIASLEKDNEKFSTEQFQNIVMKAKKLLAKSRSKIHLNKAKNYLESKEYDKVEKELIEALKLDPDSKEAKDMYERLKKIKELLK